MPHPSPPQIRARVKVGVRLILRFWEGWEGGFWEMPHPPLPQVRVRVMVGVRFIFRFMGGVGGWFSRNLD